MAVPVDEPRSIRFLLPGNSTSERFLDPITLAVARPGDDRVGFYDLTTGDEVEDLDIDDIPYDDAAGAIGVDPVGGRLVLVGSDTQVWDLESKTLLWSSDRTELPEVDPARGWVATYGNGGVITVLDLEDGSEIMTLAGHPGAVNDVAFDPTRERLYSAPYRRRNPDLGHHACRADGFGCGSHRLRTEHLVLPGTRSHGRVSERKRGGGHHGRWQNHPVRIRQRCNPGLGRRVDELVSPGTGEPGLAVARRGPA